MIEYRLALVAVSKQNYASLVLAEVSDTDLRGIKISRHSVRSVRGGAKQDYMSS